MRVEKWVEVKDGPSSKWEPRIFITSLPDGHLGRRHICVEVEYEDEYKNNRPYDTCNWSVMRELPQYKDRASILWPDGSRWSVIEPSGTLIFCNSTEKPKTCGDSGWRSAGDTINCWTDFIITEGLDPTNWKESLRENPDWKVEVVDWDLDDYEKYVLSGGGLVKDLVSLQRIISITIDFIIVGRNSYTYTYMSENFTQPDGTPLTKTKELT